jgi:hypothetical protein
MNCSQPDRLIESLLGENGAASRTQAEAHLASCASCRTALDALAAPSGAFVSFLAQREPSSTGQCPDLESLGCLFAGDPLPPEEARLISAHIAGCESCALLAAGFKLNFAKGAGFFPGQQGSSAPSPAVAAASPASVIAQVVGVVALLVLLGSFVLPRLDRVELPHVTPDTAVGALPVSTPAEEPPQASFHYRTKSDSTERSLLFPHDSQLRLSRDSEFAIQLTAQRSDLFLLLTENPDRRFTLLLPEGDSSARIPSLNSGQIARFPASSAWEPVGVSPGPHKLFAIFLDDRVAAESLVAQARRAESSASDAAALNKTLDQMASTQGCASTGAPCLQSFEYEVF